MRGTRGRTALTAKLRATFAAHDESQRRGIPVAEILGRRAERTALSRRGVLRATGVAGTAAALTGAFGTLAGPGHAVAPPGKPTVAIIGAGLAGIRAAHWLYKTKGIESTVYEASDRAGGRCYTLRGYFDDGLTVEHGGALINTDHTMLRNLVNRLGLSLYEVNGGNQPTYGDKYWIDGADYPYDEANADWGQIWQTMKAALSSAPWCQTYDSNTPAGVALDNMTVDEWLAANVPGGLSSRFAKLMRSNVIAEYGLDPDQQSALNLIYLLGWNVKGSLDPLNGADERFSVVGGNDQIVTRMLEQLPAGTVRYGRALTAVKSNANGTVTCTLRSGNTYTSVTADKVILALPFTLLRQCDLSQAGFSALKLRSINQLDLGANSKLHLQFNTRTWVQHGYGGSTYTEMAGFQCGWDDTVNQPSAKGVFCGYPGGRQVLDTWTGAAFGPAPSAQVSGLINQLSPIYPGIAGAYSGKAYRDAWTLHPWSRGAYTCQRPGQYTSFFGIEAAPQGNVHFAGEHTSVEYFGFLNGAIESAERAAKEAAS